MLILKQYPSGCKTKYEKANEIMYWNENPHAALKPRFIKKYPPQGNMAGSHTPKDDAERREETMQRNTDSEISRKLTKTQTENINTSNTSH
jgi:hypothetical protein